MRDSREFELEVAMLGKPKRKHVRQCGKICSKVNQTVRKSLPSTKRQKRKQISVKINMKKFVDDAQKRLVIS
jgi:hypothetical protein